MDLREKANEFETRKFKFVTTSDRILVSREVKALILEINEEYKKTKVKQRIEKRLKGKPLTA